MTSKGFSIRKAEEPIITDTIFAAVYGKPGVGKTSLGFTMPGPCLHLDFDEGIHRAIANKPDSVDVRRWEDFADFVFGPEFEGLIEQGGYRSVLIDTVGTLLDNVIAPAIIRRSPKNGTGGALALAGWGLLATEFNTFIQRLRKLGLHIYATAHDKEGGDEATASLLPAIKGGSLDILFRTCDLLGYVYMRGGQRYLDFNPSEIHVGKNVAGIEATVIPNANNPASGFATFMAEKIVKPSLDRMNAKSEAQAALVAKVQAFREQLAGCTTPAEFDALAGEVGKDGSELYKKQARAFLGTRIQELGIIYSKAHSRFEWAEGSDMGQDTQPAPENATEAPTNNE